MGCAPLKADILINRQSPSVTTSDRRLPARGYNSRAGRRIAPKRLMTMASKRLDAEVFRIPTGAGRDPVIVVARITLGRLDHLGFSFCGKETEILPFRYGHRPAAGCQRRRAGRSFRTIAAPISSEGPFATLADASTHDVGDHDDEQDGENQNCISVHTAPIS
jgi:hypothetical protein